MQRIVDATPTWMRLRAEEEPVTGPAVWRGTLKDGFAYTLDGRLHPALSEKYRSELLYWHSVYHGGSEAQFGGPFHQVYGGWQRGRAQEMAEFLGLVDPEAFNAWCRERTAVEIGAGPYPAVSVLPWCRAVAVDALADGYTAEGLLPKESASVVYLTAAGESVPLPTAFADVMVAENALDHVDEPERVMAEVRRLLKPGGHLWLLVDLMDYSDALHPNPFSEPVVRALLQRHGFTVVKDRISDHKSHPYAYGEYRGLLTRNAD
ncbi:MAG: methyltransferase domain-containing protein [Phycisphaeraceae bacterium]|nr:methyltransferase domain-containing protein [Phycisphaeraceae bacterium]